MLSPRLKLALLLKPKLMLMLGTVTTAIPMLMDMDTPDPTSITTERGLLKPSPSPTTMAVDTTVDTTVDTVDTDTADTVIMANCSSGSSHSKSFKFGDF